jgi:hypothetical protein
MSDATLVDIACKVVRETEKAIAITDGTTEEHADPRTGEITQRDKWFWIPKSQCEVNDDGTVTMPERVATEKGLV